MRTGSRVAASRSIGRNASQVGALSLVLHSPACGRVAVSAAERATGTSPFVSSGDSGQLLVRFVAFSALSAVRRNRAEPSPRLRPRPSQREGELAGQVITQSIERNSPTELLARPWNVSRLTAVVTPERTVALGIAVRLFVEVASGGISFVLLDGSVLRWSLRLARRTCIPVWRRLCGVPLELRQRKLASNAE